MTVEKGASGGDFLTLLQQRQPEGAAEPSAEEAKQEPTVENAAVQSVALALQLSGSVLVESVPAPPSDSQQGQNEEAQIAEGESNLLRAPLRAPGNGEPKKAAALAASMLVPQAILPSGQDEAGELPMGDHSTAAQPTQQAGTAALTAGSAQAGSAAPRLAPAATGNLSNTATTDHEDGVPQQAGPVQSSSLSGAVALPSDSGALRGGQPLSTEQPLRQTDEVAPFLEGATTPQRHPEAIVGTQDGDVMPDSETGHRHIASASQGDRTVMPGTHADRRMEWSPSSEQQSAFGDRREQAASPGPMVTNVPAFAAAAAAAPPSPAGPVSLDAPAAGAAAPPAPIEHEPPRQAGVQSVQFEVPHADVGQLRVRVVLADQTVHTHMMTDHPEMGRMLVDRQEQLGSQLSNAGLELGQLRVQVDRQGSFHAGQEWQSHLYDDRFQQQRGQPRQQEQQPAGPWKPPAPSWERRQETALSIFA
ncbi:MAG TPA: flagellar hook-length control protein FliK [Nitrospira sp.]|nr:flagellar hook-length control protein FliK [Nitrospira sp.]